MGNLVNFYEKNKRLFLAQKHQNSAKTELGRDRIMQDFLSFCESKQIFHTAGITKKTVSDYFQSKKVSTATKRKYYLVLREFFKRFFKKELVNYE